MEFDLVKRCKEILEWHQTGYLAVDGELRRFADSLENIPEKYRLDIAERKTSEEAMQYIIILSTM